MPKIWFKINLSIECSWDPGFADECQLSDKFGKIPRADDQPTSLEWSSHFFDAACIDASCNSCLIVVVLLIRPSRAKIGDAAGPALKTNASQTQGFSSVTELVLNPPTTDTGP